MSGSTGLVSATPDFVTNAAGYGGQDVRAGTLINDIPGLFASGDFAASQRAAGANMSVDIAQGRAIVDPQQATHQGLYVVRRTTGVAYNTLADGLYTWTAADASNPRIDLLCIEVKDTDMDASGVTGWRFRVVDGTPNASATHQLATTYWPAIPTGCVPIAAIRVPAAATTLTTANITNLNPIAGARPTVNAITTAENTTSATYTRLTTPDFVFVYVPNANCRVRVFSEGNWKVSVASGSQAISWFLNDVQLKARNPTNGAPAAAVDGLFASTIGTFLSRFVTVPQAALGNYLTTSPGVTADVSNITTGIAVASAAWAAGAGVISAIDIDQLAAGWYVIEQRYKTSANTITVQNRFLWAEVVAAG